MRRRITALAAAFALVRGVPASAKTRKIVVEAAGARVRIVVPAAFAPLLPGSVYPNRRKPATRRGTPIVFVERDRELLRRAEPVLLARGFIVAEMAAIDAASIDATLEALRERIEGGVGEAKLLARRPGNALDDPRVRAVALFEPPAFRPPDPSLLNCLPVAIFRRTADGRPSERPPGERPDCVSERWFRTSKSFPDDAFRDAAEWLAVTSQPDD